MLNHRARDSTHRSEELEMLARCQQIEEDVMLRTDTGHAADRPHIVRVTHIIAEYERGAGGWGGQAREYVKKSGLASAVVAEYRGDLTLVDG